MQAQTYEQCINLQVREKSEEKASSILFNDADYRGVVWNITQTLFPRSLVPGEFKFIDLHA